jgi:hypothetical protein
MQGKLKDGRFKVKTTTRQKAEAKRAAKKRALRGSLGGIALPKVPKWMSSLFALMNFRVTPASSDEADAWDDGFVPDVNDHPAVQRLRLKMHRFKSKHAAEGTLGQKLRRSLNAPKTVGHFVTGLIAIVVLAAVFRGWMVYIPTRSAVNGLFIGIFSKPKQWGIIPDVGEGGKDGLAFLNSLLNDTVKFMTNQTLEELDAAARAAEREAWESITKPTADSWANFKDQLSETVKQGKAQSKKNYYESMDPNDREEYDRLRKT